MASPAEVVAQLITDLGLAGTADWPVYVSGQPNSPDNVVTTFDISGDDKGRTMFDGKRTEWKGVQILVRSSTPEEGAARAEAIKAGVLVVVNERVSIGGDYYLISCVSVKSGVLNLGNEPDTGRAMFSLNLLVTMKEVA